MKYFVDCQILGLCHDFFTELSRKTNSQRKLKKEWELSPCKIVENASLHLSNVTC